jgi:hypothetical protein
LSGHNNNGKKNGGGSADRDVIVIGDQEIGLGESRDLRLKISETYTGDEIALPVRIYRGSEPGPRVFVTAGVHGDEVNGIGIVHDLMFTDPLTIERGTLILVPVVNVFGFETHERYLPDRRDLNRAFPGTDTGSLAGRIAHVVMEEIIRGSDYGIDLHSAAFQRTNFPNVRGDMKYAGVRRLAKAFGCPLTVAGKGPDGSLRSEACRAGVPTIILEAGEPWKIEPSVLEIGTRGVRNVLKELGMTSGRPVWPKLQINIRKTEWVRAEVGGILRFHVGPGDLVEKDQPLATNYTVLGQQQNVLISPANGILLGMTTMPAVKPGEPVGHIAVPRRKFETLRRQMEELARSRFHRTAARDLATNIAVSEPEDSNGD